MAQAQRGQGSEASWLAAFAAAQLRDETVLLPELRALADIGAAPRAAAQARARRWVQTLRAAPAADTVFDQLLREYALSSAEGVVLMGLAEALLRVPDAATAEQLIADRLRHADWAAHQGRSPVWQVNAASWALLLGGRLLHVADDAEAPLTAGLARLGEPLLRRALNAAMRQMGAHFVVGAEIESALQRAGAQPHSFDMLGEAALTAADAERYFAAYRHAITVVGMAGGGHGVSVKLSALHPRYGYAQAGRVRRELVPRLLALAQAAASQQIVLTVDAEEGERLELGFEVFAAVCRDRSLAGWDGFGCVVQAYQKRALPLLDALLDLAQQCGRRLPLRLVKGAYWDSEVKRAQELGLADYPVYTQKAHTDLSYLACARRLFDAGDRVYPMFATHNAHTLAMLHAHAERAERQPADYEFQRLHGMGEGLHALASHELGVRSRVYAPVGKHAELLPYLVRRLLENGANTAFVHQLHDPQCAIDALVADPLMCETGTVDRVLPKPPALYGGERRNSRGFALDSALVRRQLRADIAAATVPVQARSQLAIELPATLPRVLVDPADTARTLGAWQPLDPAQLPALLRVAAQAQADWDARGVAARAALIERAAELLQAEPAALLRLLHEEAGKTLPDALAEWRETIDLLRYYAASARQLMTMPQTLVGPTGEHNELQLHGRGVFACIAPWNFPLAIFGGQIAAALLAGNSVIAKPAEQTPRIAGAFVAFLHRAGVPREVLQCVLGDGGLGAALCAQAALAGVAFTGSFAVARAIQQTLAARDAPLAVLVAETGGLNALIADSTALPEQLVRDVLASAFGAAGQRCSALRVLYLQDEIAEPVLTMLRGALAEWRVGPPSCLASDCGPLIDAEARAAIAAHLARLQREARAVAAAPFDAALATRGHFIAPQIFEVRDLDAIGGEHFGPVLHVIRYHSGALDAVIDALNASGYGLTLGVHSRIESVWRRVQARTRVGNCYVNRGITGAVVGTQPFGGEGWSGTGFKAGGPHYLLRFVTERCLTVNLAAVGGNVGLLAGTPRS